MEANQRNESLEAGVRLPSVASLRKHHHKVKNHLEDFSLAEIIGDFTPNSVSASTTPLVHLNRVSLRQLQLERHSKGNYVLIRILEPGVQVIGWLWVIEDDEGNGCMLNVYNYPPLELPCVGTVLIVKEPFLTVTTLKIPLIRCDCPTDIVVLMRSNLARYRLARAVEWRNRLGKMEDHEDFVLHRSLTLAENVWNEYGNRMLRSGFYSLALESYLLGALACPDNNSRLWKTILSNLCGVYLHLGYYEKTIATSCLIREDRNAILSAGKAYYKLRKFTEAKEVFHIIISKNPNDLECLKEYEKSCNRVRETSGDFWGVDQLIRACLMFPTGRLPIGDYIGPVQVIDIPDKGRGLQLTHDVLPGTILLVSKAFAATMDPEKFFDSNLPSKDELNLKPLIDSMELEAQIAQAIFKNPLTFGKMVYDLSTGAVPHNEFQLFCEPLAKAEHICDMVTIKAISKCNHFMITPQLDETQRDLGPGLFIVPSYLNHSSHPNVSVTFYNDIMYVRSIGQLKAGVELCVDYFPGVQATCQSRY